MALQLIIENGNDYRNLQRFIRDAGYECRGRGGHDIFTMADGTRAVYTIFVDTHAGDTKFVDFIQDSSEGKVEIRTDADPKF